MPLNLELKASIPSPEKARAAATRCGAHYEGILLQEDTYFSVPHGRLKLREIAGQGAELIFYERPEVTSERWSTYSRQVIAEPALMKAQLSSALGVRVVVRKKRTLYLLGATRIHIDDVEGLGTFLEFEVPVTDEQDASEQMQQLREQFGVTEGAIFKASYSDLISAKTEALGA